MQRRQLSSKEHCSGWDYMSNGVKLGKANSGSNIRTNLLLVPPMTHETHVAYSAITDTWWLKTRLRGTKFLPLKENQELKSYFY